MIWVYFMTGVRVNEGCALQWNDVDFDKQRLRVHHMLIVKNKKEWTRNSYSKTHDGKRMISLDIDTINVLRKWREAQKKIGLGHSSPEITLKHYSHLWDGADEVITNEMGGIINVSFPSSSLVHFNGNQAISK